MVFFFFLIFHAQNSQVISYSISTCKILPIALLLIVQVSYFVFITSICWLKDNAENAGILATYLAEIFSSRKLVLFGFVVRFASLIVVSATLKGFLPSRMWIAGLSVVAEPTLNAASRNLNMRPF